MFLGSKVRRLRKADNITAIYEPIVLTMWDPTFHNPIGLQGLLGDGFTLLYLSIGLARRENIGSLLFLFSSVSSNTYVDKALAYYCLSSFLQDYTSVFKHKSLIMKEKVVI
jgi:hypothetical protein